jgi:uncharacterized beta-barrel protein YwiB (DUF1934 family)
MKVMVKITASIKDEEKEANDIEFTTEGEFTYEEDHIRLEYQESEFSGMSGSQTLLAVYSDQMIMRRAGNGASEMVFKNGHRHETDYSTPYGVLKVEMLTKNFSCTLEPDTGKGIISVHYDMSISGLTESDNRLTIEVL